MPFPRTGRNADHEHPSAEVRNIVDVYSKTELVEEPISKVYRVRERLSADDGPGRFVRNA